MTELDDKPKSRETPKPPVWSRIYNWITRRKDVDEPLFYCKVVRDYPTYGFSEFSQHESSIINLIAIEIYLDDGEGPGIFRFIGRSNDSILKPLYIETRGGIIPYPGKCPDGVAEMLIHKAPVRIRVR